MTAGRDRWYHELKAGRTIRRHARASRWTARTCSFSCTRRGRRRGRRGSRTRPPGISSAWRRPTPDLRFEAGDGRLLVRGRHRLDHGPHLHRLRAALQRRHVGHVRGHARLPGPGALVGDRRALRRLDPVHGADGDPRAHEMGARARCRSTTDVPPPARVGRRADQPRGLGLVPRAHRGERCPIVDTWWQTERG